MITAHAIPHSWQGLSRKAQVTYVDFRRGCMANLKRFLAPHHFLVDKFLRLPWVMHPKPSCSNRVCSDSLVAFVFPSLRPVCRCLTSSGITFALSHVFSSGVFGRRLSSPPSKLNFARDASNSTTSALDLSFPKRRHMLWL